MANRLPQLIIMLSGAVLIAFGCVMIYLQFAQETAASLPRPSRSLEFDPTGRSRLETTYVGLVVVAIGAILEAVGYLGTVPWRRTGPQQG